MCSSFLFEGVKRRLLEHSSLTPEEEEYVQQVLDSLYTSLPRRQRAYVRRAARLHPPALAA
jgi:hypothetical protein